MSDKRVSDTDDRQRWVAGLADVLCPSGDDDDDADVLQKVFSDPADHELVMEELVVRGAKRAMDFIRWALANEQCSVVTLSGEDARYRHHCGEPVVGFVEFVKGGQRVYRCLLHGRYGAEVQDGDFVQLIDEKVRVGEA